MDRKQNRLAAASTISVSLLGTKAKLCHMGRRCVRKCRVETTFKDKRVHTRCHAGKCWPEG